MDAKINYNPDQTIKNIEIIADTDKTLILEFTIKDNKDAINVKYTDSTLSRTINQVMTKKELSNYVSVLLEAHESLPKANIPPEIVTNYAIIWDKFDI